MREIEKAKDITRKETGAFKYDFVYDRTNDGFFASFNCD